MNTLNNRQYFLGSFNYHYLQSILIVTRQTSLKSILERGSKWQTRDHWVPGFLLNTHLFRGGNEDEGEGVPRASPWPPHRAKESPHRAEEPLALSYQGQWHGVPALETSQTKCEQRWKMRLSFLLSFLSSPLSPSYFPVFFLFSLSSSLMDFSLLLSPPPLSLTLSFLHSCPSSFFSPSVALFLFPHLCHPYYVLHCQRTKK